MYSMYAVKRGYKTEIINANETELGGYKEISFMITGDGAYSRLKYESGVHRVQRVPETETQGAEFILQQLRLQFCQRLMMLRLI